MYQYKMRLNRAIQVFVFVFIGVSRAQDTDYKQELLESFDPDMKNRIESFSLISQQDSRNLQQATGFYENYAITWEINQFNQNLLDMTLYVEVVVRQGSVSNFGMNIYHSDFGQVVAGSVEAKQNGTLLRGTSGEDGFRLQSSGFYQSNNQLLDTISNGERAGITYTYQVLNGVCKKGDKVGVATTWASLVQIDTTNIEYIYRVNIDELSGSNTIVNHSPQGRPKTIEKDGFRTIHVAYSQSDLDFGPDSKENSFFYWEPNQFAGSDSLNECQEYEQSYLIFIIIAAIPITLCVCLVGCAFIQYFVNKNAANSRSRRRRGNGNVAYYRENRDIILVPEDDPPEHRINAPIRPAQSNLLRAIPEERDEGNRLSDDFFSGYTRSFRIRLNTQSEQEAESEIDVPVR